MSHGAAASEQSWELRINKDDLTSATVAPQPQAECGPGQVLLRIDRVGMSANNVTYAALGEAFRYWEFFPTVPGSGLVPLWGFADVAESRVAGIEVGERFYGYYPSASHLLTTPGRVDGRGFNDAAEHRRGLPSPYNTYARTTTDAAYDPDTEDLLALYRPLFLTSLMWADWLLERDAFGANTVVISSASSKTAYGAAHCLRMLQAERREQAQPLRIFGLTSGTNREFTTSLGVYDEVVAYGEMTSQEASFGEAPTVYADFSGSAELLETVQRVIGVVNLVQHVVVGITSQETSGAGALAGADNDSTFFAPLQVRHRIDEWGLAEVDSFLAHGWHSFVTHVQDWVDIRASHGPQALLKTWFDLQAGVSDPRHGHVIVM